MNEQENQKELSSAKTLGIVSLVCAFLCWPAAIICGHISLSKYKKLGGITEGKGLAKAGLIIGYIGLVITILYIIGIAVFFGAAASGGLEGLEGLQSIPVE